MLDNKKQILIVGLGLIGGSYAKAFKKRGFRVTAIDIDREALNYAMENGVINYGMTESVELISAADIIVLGLYPDAVVGWIEKNQKYFKPDTMITDVSGVKRNVVDKAQEILRPDVEFIGSHPMAGREVSGVQNSDDSIFKPANFIITPTKKNTEAGIKFARDLAETLGFNRISELTIEEHDEMIGYLSQLTHAIAVSLMNANGNPNLVQYTGDSFRDLTRIAKINEALWSELFFLNKDKLVPEIDSFVNELQNLKEKLVSGDSEGLKALFVRSTERRRLFDRKG